MGSAHRLRVTVNGYEYRTTVGVMGGQAIVGSRNDDAGGTDTGAVYVFHDTGTGWQQADKLYAPDPSEFDGFGRGVDLDYPYAVVGTRNDDDPFGDAGSVFVYRHDGTTWQLVADLDSPSPLAGGEFGWDAATNGEYVIASAYNSPRLTAVFGR